MLLAMTGIADLRVLHDIQEALPDYRPADFARTLLQPLGRIVMTIAITRSRDRFATEYIEECASIIERSNAHNMIEEFWCQDRRTGGRPRSGTQYSLLAVLVIGLALIGTCRALSMAEIYRRIWDLDEELQQRLRVELHGTQEENSYTGFAMWRTRKLAPLDSLPDIPARRIKKQRASKGASLSNTRTARAESHRIRAAVSSCKRTGRSLDP